MYFIIPKAIQKSTVLGVLNLSRLIRPYAVWTSVYLLLRMIKNGSGLFSSSLEDWFGFLFLGQSAVHLYFLPLLIYYQIVAAASALLCSNLVNGKIHLHAACWITAAMIMSIIAGHIGYFGWSSAFLSALIYTALEAGSKSLNQKIRRGWFAVVILASVLMMGLALIAAFEVKMPSTYYVFNGPIFGCCALLLLIRMGKGIPPRWAKRLVNCYFGIYLSHHAIEECIEVACAKFGHALTPYDLLPRLGYAFVAFCGGIIITCLIRLSPRLAFWMLGEKHAEFA